MARGLCFLLLELLFVVSAFSIVSLEKKPTEQEILTLMTIRNQHYNRHPNPVKHVEYQLKPNSQGKIYRPVVLMYGITGDNNTMAVVEGWIKAVFPSIYVKRVQIGDGTWDSIFMPMNDQVKEFCSHIAADDNLKDGFNVIGYSQGSLISRGYIQRCNNPKVFNFISWAGPQAGQFGLPWINIDILDYYLGSFPYYEPIQSWLAPAQFWKDPYDLDDYLSVSLFLPDLNNEKAEKNQQYKTNFVSINQLVLIYSTNDTTIRPKESGWFSSYKENSLEVIPVQETPFYQEDWIGLRTLDEQGKIYWGKTNCIHNEHPRDPCKQYFELHTLPYLNNTLY